MAKTLPPHYHRDLQRRRALSDPQWYQSRKYDRTAHRRAHKEYWIKHFGGVCSDCRLTYPATVFEFHHLSEEAKKRVPNRQTSYVLMLSRERAARELKKCVMLCANCHRIRHANIGYHKTRRKVT